MVFGWGKKKTTENTTESAQKIQVSFSEIPLILKENENRLLRKILEQSKSIKEQIDAEQKNILQTVLQFEKDDLNSEDVDRNLRIIIERVKKAVVSGIKKETAVTLTNPENYSNLLALNSQTAQMLKRMGDVLGLNSRVMHVFARKYADKLKIELASMSNNKKQLQSFVDEYTDFESMEKHIIEQNERINFSKNEIENKNNRLSEIKTEINDNKKTISSLEIEIKAMRSTKEYQEFLTVNKEVESLLPEKNHIKNEVDLQFSKISRPLGKYSYISSLEKSLKTIMEQLISDPLETITSENKNAIIEILQAVVKSVVAGNVSVKDSQKSVEQIEETIRKLDEFIKLKNTLAKKTGELKNKLAIFNVIEIEEREKKIDKVREEIPQLESSIKILEGEIIEESNRIPEAISDIEKSISKISGTKITLKI